jgi:dephospho-CoA kinase
MIFGLTGGICCGKSTVSNTLQEHGIPMVDADIVARQVVEVGTKGWAALRETFGLEYFYPSLALDRAKFGAFVFSNKEAMDKLNTIMTPLIEDEANRQINVFLNEGQLVVGYDAALICEMNLAEKYRPLIVVSCPRHMQIERLVKRNNLTEAEAVIRIDAQMTSAEKEKMADFIIDTSTTVEESIKTTEFIIPFLTNSW